MSSTLNARILSRLPADIRRPQYDFTSLGVGILHLGLGAFHRAHQAIYTEDAILSAGGRWGIAAAAFRNEAVPEALRAQDHLYTVETLRDVTDYRITAVIRESLTARTQPAALTAKFIDAQIHIVTLTITEKGYCLGPDGTLDFTHPDVAHDLEYPCSPVSAVGWIALGLVERGRAHASPLTVVSCDNLQCNGAKLGGAVAAFIERTRPDALPWLRHHVRFPQSVVDCIVPASSETSRRRVSGQLGVTDTVAVQREPYSQWVIEDTFAGPRPAWDRVGVRLVADVNNYARLKLYVLNSCHSALAYLGLPRGHNFVRDAIADKDIAAFLDELVEYEITPALAPLKVDEYWSVVRRRLANPHIDHRLAQIAEDGAAKLSQRVFPLMVLNQRTGAPIAKLARIVRAWLDLERIEVGAALSNRTLLPAAIRASSGARAAILAAVT